MQTLQGVTRARFFQKGSAWVLDTEVSAVEGVGRFVAGLAHEIKIIEGEELKEYLRKYTAKYMAKIG